MTERLASTPVAVVQDYLAALGRGDTEAAARSFAPELTYIAPGRNRLAGTTHGAGAAGGWFAAMAALSAGTYGLVEAVDWLADDTHALLLAREHAEIEGRTHDWTRAVLFAVADGQITRVQLMEDDQYGYDAWLGGDSGDRGAQEPGEAYPADPVPQVAGRVEDPRVQAVLAYQQAVAAGRLDEAREVFWDDVVYTVPGRSLLAGEYAGPEAVMGYLGRLMELTGGRYAISRMRWLTSAGRVGLATRNHAERNGRTLSWDELIVFEFVDGRKKRISHFSGDQEGVDAVFAP